MNGNEIGGSGCKSFQAVEDGLLACCAAQNWRGQAKACTGRFVEAFISRTHQDPQLFDSRGRPEGPPTLPPDPRAPPHRLVLGSMAPQTRTPPRPEHSSWMH